MISRQLSQCCSFLFTARLSLCLSPPSPALSTGRLVGNRVKLLSLLLVSQLQPYRAGRDIKGTKDVCYELRHGQLLHVVLGFLCSRPQESHSWRTDVPDCDYSHILATPGHHLSHSHNVPAFQLALNSNISPSRLVFFFFLTVRVLFLPPSSKQPLRSLVFQSTNIHSFNPAIYVFTTLFKMKSVIALSALAAIASAQDLSSMPQCAVST